MRQEELGKLNSHIEQIYSGLLVVKTYNGKNDSDKKFDKYNESVRMANQKSQFLSGLMPPVMQFIGNFGYVAVCISGALLVQNGAITFGTIVAFITYVRLFTSPLSRIAQSASSLQSAAAASERVFEFIDETELISETKFTEKVDKSKIKGDIDFSHVWFSYEKDKPTIKNFNAKAKAGQKIAIVGPTGAGKTTLVNLLMKFYDIDSGEIVIDGHPTSKMKRSDLHSLFTMVLQDTWMFEGSLRDNIVYNRKNISDKKIMEICDKIGLSHFVKTLPDGLDTEIGENESISAGQKQLITIARGMVEDAPFLILDEATSNVDTRTEELVQAAMDKLMEGRTSFIIAHRLSTIRNADKILVLRDGDVVEAGTHNELMKQNGFYAELYNSQFAL
jgi:ATP-binding cassette subfamily B protein